MYKFIKNGLNIWDSAFMQQDGFKCYSRLLYMYFLTCPLSNILGVYEISDERIKSDLKLWDDELRQGLAELKELKKVRRYGRFIIIQDAIHYIKQDAKAFKEIDKIISSLPEKIRERLPKKAVAIIEEYKRKQEEKRIKRIQTKIEKTQLMLDFCKLSNDESKKESLLQKPSLSDNIEMESKIASNNKENMLEENILKDFDSFDVEPSDASINACNQEDNEHYNSDDDVIAERAENGISRYLNNRGDAVKNDDGSLFFECDVLPSEVSLQKMQEAQKKKRKKELPDEVVFPLLKERLEPIYANMSDIDWMPKGEIVTLAHNALVDFMQENNIKADALDTSWLNMREFKKQALMFSCSAEVKEENKKIALQVSNFSEDEDIAKERKETVEKNINFCNDEENIKIRNDKNFLDVKKNYDNEEQYFGLIEKKQPRSEKKERECIKDSGIILSKDEFDEYIKNLNDKAFSEEEIEKEKDMPVIKKVWSFYRKRGRYEKLSFDDFCEQFELAKRKFRVFNIDVMDAKQLDALLFKLDRHIRKSNDAKVAKIPFITLAQNYTFYEPILNKC